MLYDTGAECIMLNFDLFQSQVVVLEGEDEDKQQEVCLKTFKVSKPALLTMS